MGRQMPYDDIPESNVFPSGDYHVQGIKLEEMLSNNGKLMYNMDIQIMEHPNTAPFTNMHYFENFVIGSDEDLEATVAGTWVQSVGARRLKQVLKAAQVAEKNDMDKICAGFAGVQFMTGLQEYKEPAKQRDGQENPYAGQPRNKSVGFYKIGEREPKLEVKKGVPGQPVVTTPVQPTPPVTPQPAAMGQPVAQPAPAVAQPAVPATPTPATPPVQQPNVPVTPAPQPVAVEGGPATLPCGACGGQVPTKEYAEHIKACMAKQTQGG